MTSMFVPTEEQRNICEFMQTNKIFKVEACAGSGKTKTLLYLSQQNIKPSLLLVFNKDNQRELHSKFPKHVNCKTSHGLAFSHCGSQYIHRTKRPFGRYKNIAQTASEIAIYFKLTDYKFLNTTGKEQIIRKKFIGELARECVTNFEQSAFTEINEHCFDLKGTLKKQMNGQSQIFKVQEIVLKIARSLWSKRIDMNSDTFVTHDTYFKIYALTNPDLSKYETIYLDEAQDTNMAMLNILLQQIDKGVQIIAVGDPRQAIYEWRGAVNALSKIEAHALKLTKSFRYGPKVAAIANFILNPITPTQGLESLDTKVGLKAVNTTLPYTMIFRTNIELIIEAVRLIEKGVKVYININSKQILQLFTSVEALKNNKMNNVKHESVIPFSSWKDLMNEKNRDNDLNLTIQIIEQGDSKRVIHVLENHENVHITDYDALLITAHKAKGLEWTQVIMADDFPRCKKDSNTGDLEPLITAEENLLYVAATRATHNLSINKSVTDYITLRNGNKSFQLDI
jgi:superfamily I DNA/RNA helicase